MCKVYAENMAEKTMKSLISAVRMGDDCRYCLRIRKGSNFINISMSSLDETSQRGKFKTTTVCCEDCEDFITFLTTCVKIVKPIYKGSYGSTRYYYFYK